MTDVPIAPVRSFDSALPDWTGRTILVTGGTGSFGQRFIRDIVRRYKVRKVIVFSRDEMKQYEMEQVLSPHERACIRFFIGDVRDENRLEMAMREVDHVVHAAALKHVPAAEYNPIECVRTNIHGAENVVTAALRAGVKRVITLSTDKACNPVNLYGATKLAADKIFVAANSLAGSQDTRFAVVRYGNVIGSRGSVLPYFRKLLAEGATRLPITDPRMTRFWITLDQGIAFVLTAFALMEGGEIFVPKIPSMKVADLARAIAPSLEHDVIGIRAGEKLHEVMISEDDARNTVAFDDRYVVLPAFHAWRADGHLQDTAVPDGFRYASDSNEEWLDSLSLQTLLAAAGV